LPLAKEKVFSGRLVAWHGAFSRRRIQRGNQGGESIQRVGRQIERRHTCRWNPVLDQAAQLLSRSFAHPGVSSKPWALLRTMGIGSMAAGAKLRVHLLGVHLGRRGWRILRAQPELAQYERATSIRPKPPGVLKVERTAPRPKAPCPCRCYQRSHRDRRLPWSDRRRNSAYSVDAKPATNAAYETGTHPTPVRTALCRPRRTMTSLKFSGVSCEPLIVYAAVLSIPAGDMCEARAISRT